MLVGAPRWCVAMFIEPGTLIGQYRVLSLLGEGGMGVVYYAEHVVLGQPAAIKVLLRHVAARGELVQRFINEARIAARMKHRNIVDVLDCGMFPSPTAPDAQWYIALEFLHGKSLGRLIAEYEGRPIELTTILHILGEAANGLHAAHEQHDLVHRDIKPDNIFIIQAEDDPMRVKILDFGIAKLNQPGSGVETQSQTAMGTPAYAAPEQLRESKDVDRRADVFALGVIVYEMATGVRPWGSTTSVWEIIAQHSAMKKPPDPRAVRPNLPKRWAETVMRAMEPDPNRRWKTAKDFLRALAEATPMPFSANGMAILNAYARELTQASSHSLTVGRPLPPELQRSPAQVATAPERGALAGQPATVSDGVPQLASPRTPLMAAEPGHPISTIPSASGQAIAAVASGARGRRAPLLVGAALAASVGVAVAVTLALSGGPDADRPKAEAAAVLIDASAAPALEAEAATSALAIITEPTNADVFIDGVSHGAAPINVRLRVGAEIEVRAEMPGHEPSRRSLRIGAEPATVRLDLVRVVDAAPPKMSEPKEDRRRSRGKRRPGGAGDGSGAGSGFDPNDVL